MVSRRGRFWVGVFLLALAFAMLAEDVGWAQPGGTPPDRTPPMDEVLDGWGERVEALRDSFDVPGAAVGVVRGDSVAFARGVGTLRQGGNRAVDTGTRFAVGSATKSMTAAVVGRLVEEGRLGWDDPVAAHLPGFRLKDAERTARVTIRDLLSHRTGLRNDNLLFWGTELSRDELVRRLRHLDAPDGLRERFAYNNLGYVAAGAVVEAVADTAWEAALRHELLGPLKAERATPTTPPGAGSAPNTATPHALTGSGREPVPHLDLTNAAPAGGVYASLDGMTAWARMMLGRGTLGDRAVLDTATVQAVTTPQAIVTEPVFQQTWPEATTITYGMGWFVHDYHGTRVVEHGGNTDGMTSLVALLPETDVGIVVLTNAGSTLYPQALAHELFDRVLGRTPESGWTRYRALTRRYQKAYAQIDALFDAPSDSQNERDGKSRSSPTHDLPAFTGTYTHPLYGPLTIRDGRDSERLTVDLGDLGIEGTLHHRHHNTFRVVWRDRSANALVAQAIQHLTIHLNARGTPATVTPTGRPGMLSPNTRFKK